MYIALLIALASISTMAESTDQCQVAWPQFGVVRCEIDTNAQPTYPSIAYTSRQSDSLASYQCSGRCDIENKGSIENNMACSSLDVKHWKVYRSGTEIADSGGFFGGGYSSFPIQFNDQDSITIQSWCSFLGVASPLQSNSYVTIRVWQKYLYETTPDWGRHKIESTTGCAPQTWITNYLSQGVSSGSVPSSWVDSTGSTKDTISTHPNVQYNLQNLPTVMPIDTDYSYFYKWIIVPDINLVYDKEGKTAGYCGGTTGNRKLFSYSEVTTIGGNCYLIPSSVQRSVECCANEDCKWNPSKPTCDTSTFSCSDKKPCNSDVECQVPGQTSICSNKQETVWDCDANQKWYPYAGTCIQTILPVACCSDNECGIDQYCNKQQGCLDKYNLVDCPQDKWCLRGGRYKPQSCSSELKACPSADPMIGDCKDICEMPQKGMSPAELGRILNATINEFGNIDVETSIAGIPVKVTIGKEYENVQNESPLALGPVMGLAIKYLPYIIGLL